MFNPAAGQEGGREKSLSGLGLGGSAPLGFQKPVEGFRGVDGLVGEGLDFVDREPALDGMARLAGHLSQFGNCIAGFGHISVSKKNKKKLEKFL